MTARFAGMPPSLIGVEACVDAHHLSRNPNALGHDAGLVLERIFLPVS